MLSTLVLCNFVTMSNAPRSGKLPLKYIFYTCRSCPDCDLLIAHQDEIERLLAATFVRRDPSMIGQNRAPAHRVVPGR